MNDLTKHQLVLLVLLVSFVVSVSTVLITITIVDSVPQSATDTSPLERIIERVGGHAPTQAPQAQSPISQEDLIVGVVSRVSPAVVSIIATKDLPVVERFFTDPFGGDSPFSQLFPQFEAPAPKSGQPATQRQEIGAGSGFIVTADGLVVTNRHVVEDKEAEYTVITNDGKKHTAKVMARDPVQDIAVVKIEGAGYPTVKLGNSDVLKIGQTAIAIGNALGEFQNTVSVGIVSGLKRSITAGGAASGAERLQEVIQTDAAINPGNSGGPLLNSLGEVIGINTAMAGGAENIGFTLPVNIIKRDLDKVKASGKITYPFLGVRYVIITPEVQKAQKLPVDRGALIVSSQDGSSAVVPNSPASKAGLKDGDIILQLGGQDITKDAALADLIQKHRIGENITLTILRDGKQMNVAVVLGER